MSVKKIKKYHILVIHGPNLNLLGQREPNLYGRTSLNDINNALAQIAADKKITIEFFQSAAESDIINKIHSTHADGFVANFAAFTHTSIALRDAILAVQKPLVEVHLSNVYKREDFRHHSYFADIAVGVIAGFGQDSYEFGLLALINHLSQKK